MGAYRVTRARLGGGNQHGARVDPVFEADGRLRQNVLLLRDGLLLQREVGIAFDI